MVGNLLLILNDGKNVFNSNSEIEINTFWILSFFMEERGFKGFLIDNTPKLFEIFSKFNRKMQIELPDIWKHINNFGLHSEMCFSSYFLTIMSNDCPFDLSKRIMELFLVFGQEILINFLIKVLKLFKIDILKIRKIENCFTFLKVNLMNEFYKRHSRDFQRILVEL